MMLKESSAFKAMFDQVKAGWSDKYGEAVIDAVHGDLMNNPDVPKGELVEYFGILSDALDRREVNDAAVEVACDAGGKVVSLKAGIRARQGEVQQAQDLEYVGQMG